MLDYIDKHSKPSGAVNLCGYIFNLIDIKQGADEPMVTLRARFSRVFAALKMGGVDIGLALQVGFMLRSLLSCYSTVVTDYWLGHHSLTSATLQSVAEHVQPSTRMHRLVPSAATVVLYAPCWQILPVLAQVSHLQRVVPWKIFLSTIISLAGARVSPIQPINA
jgi:hypothetical protein